MASILTMAGVGADGEDVKMTGPPPDCLKCRHFYVTWDPSFPRGCRLFGIKTRRLPSQEVRESTGRDCPAWVLSEKKP